MLVRLSMRTNQPGHLTSFDYRGLHRYSLTFCTNFRQKAFLDEAIVELVKTQIFRAAVDTHFAVIAYCFMPDHLHLLVEGQQDDADCLRFIKLAKQYSGFYFARARHCKLWQRYGFEHVLRDEELTRVVARYILQNPVRAGLVEAPMSYPFVGSQVYSLRELLDEVAESGST